MRLLLLLCLGLLLAGCVTTKRATVSGFNDGDDTWRHTNEDTEKTRTATGDAERTTFEDKLAAKGAGTVAKWLATPVFAVATGSDGAGRVLGSVAGRAIEFVVAEIRNRPPPITPYAPAIEGAATDDVRGLVLRLEFPWDMAWMEDDRQSSLDSRGTRELTMRIRAYGHWQTLALSRDSNTAYGWIATAPFNWPRGHPIQIGVYDEDAALDDGMVVFEIPDVNYYYKLVVKDGDKYYTVGKLGFLSESDVDLMNTSYPDLRVSLK